MATEQASIVAGAGGGIGRTIALELARRGFAVACADWNLKEATITAEQVQARGGRAIPLATDTTSPADIARMRHQVVEELGRIDALVYSSGVLARTPAVALPIDEWRRVIEANLTGAFLCAQAVHGPMKERGGGRIITIGSIAAHSTSVLGGPHYTASKAGLLGLTRHLAREWASDGILVNSVSPGFIQSPMTRAAVDPGEEQIIVERIPMGRAGNSDEVAAVVGFLVSDEASYLTGIDVPVHGGLSL